VIAVGGIGSRVASSLHSMYPGPMLSFSSLLSRMVLFGGRMLANAESQSTPTFMVGVVPSDVVWCIGSFSTTRRASKRPARFITSAVGAECPSNVVRGMWVVCAYKTLSPFVIINAPAARACESGVG